MPWPPAASVVLTAGYILWTLQRVFLGKPKEDGLSDGHGHGHGESHAPKYPDLSLREIIIAAPLVIFTVVLGVYPSLVLNWMSPSVTNVVNQIVSSPTARAYMQIEQTTPKVATPAPE